jgi:hypothetical protein
MTIETEFRNRCRQIAGLSNDDTLEPTTMVGFFQRFRPQGKGIEHLYRDVPQGEEFQSRLARLFQAAGEDQRPGGGRDAYFVVRRPASLSPADVEEHATSWLTGVRQIARQSSVAEFKERFDEIPKVRVLQGIPPKQPKSDQESFSLLRCIKVHAASVTDGIAPNCEVVSLLREAYYFTACDAILRDYLLWPAYAEHFDQDDPYLGYFELWRHGIKWRVFHDDMIDFYLPPSGA